MKSLTTSWRVRLLVAPLLVALGGCEDEPPSPTDPSGGAREVLGVAVPASCAVYHDDSSVGHHGTPVREIWVGCSEDGEKLETWFESQTVAGVVQSLGKRRWRSGQVDVRIVALDDRPRAAGSPPKTARSLLSLEKVGEPTPCPPCGRDIVPPPGCSCP